MQIPKLLPTVCAAVFCASFISVRADDTPVQAAARGALEQKMSELDTQQTQAPPFVVLPSGAVEVQPSRPITNTVPAQTPTPAATATTPEPTPMPAAPVAPEPQSPPAATMPTELAPATSPPAETKPAPMMTPVEPAAAATITSETNAAPAASGTTPAAPVATMPTEVTPATPPPTETKPAPPAITPAAGTVLQSPVRPATIKVKPGVMSATNQINAIYTGKELGLKPIESPLLPISAAQQAQLQALLAKYKANQITPEEYHNQRAEILAQP